jgi:hypothetical protein
VDERFGIAVAHGREQAELVAAEAVYGAGPPGDLRELRAEAREECVARGMSEGVVVALEAVEVEDEEGRCRVLASRYSRSVTRRRRLPRPVSASVIASWCVSSKSRRFSRNVTASLTTTRTSVAVASTTASRLMLMKWS